MTELHVKPSHFVRVTRVYRSWCTITVCGDCGLRAKYEDCHPVEPCPNCGGKLAEMVGRWVRVRRGTWWKLWTDAVYRWQVKGEVTREA